jgi:hypothetical protein
MRQVAVILPTSDVFMTGGADPANSQSGVQIPNCTACSSITPRAYPRTFRVPVGEIRLLTLATVLRKYGVTTPARYSCRTAMSGQRAETAPTQPDTPLRPIRSFAGEFRQPPIAAVRWIVGAANGAGFRAGPEEKPGQTSIYLIGRTRRTNSSRGCPQALHLAGFASRGLTQLMTYGPT